MSVGVKGLGLERARAFWRIFSRALVFARKSGPDWV
jgi:hypothetical protein